MGMVQTFYAIDDSMIERIDSKLEQSILLEEFLDTMDVVNAPSSIVNIDKAWHGIHFLLNQSPFKGEYPLNFICSGASHSIKLDDTGYNYAHAYYHKQVIDIYNAISQMTESDLLAAYSPQIMHNYNIYPDIWIPSEESRGIPGFSETKHDEIVTKYLIKHFEALRDFLGFAKNSEHGFLTINH